MKILMSSLSRLWLIIALMLGVVSCENITNRDTPLSDISIQSKQDSGGTEISDSSQEDYTDDFQPIPPQKPLPSQLPEEIRNGMLINPILGRQNLEATYPINLFPSPFEIESNSECSPELVIIPRRDNPNQSGTVEKIGDAFLIKTALFYLQLNNNCPNLKKYARAYYFSNYFKLKKLQQLSASPIYPFKLLYSGCFKPQESIPDNFFAVVLLEDGSLVKSQEIDIIFDAQESCDSDRQLTNY